jgi:hypothetical protein
MDLLEQYGISNLLNANDDPDLWRLVVHNFFGESPSDLVLLFYLMNEITDSNYPDLELVYLRRKLTRLEASLKKLQHYSKRVNKLNARLSTDVNITYQDVQLGGKELSSMRCETDSISKGIDIEFHSIINSWPKDRLVHDIAEVYILVSAKWTSQFKPKKIILDLEDGDSDEKHTGLSTVWLLQEIVRLIPVNRGLCLSELRRIA